MPAAPASAQSSGRTAKGKNNSGTSAHSAPDPAGSVQSAALAEAGLRRLGRYLRDPAPVDAGDRQDQARPRAAGESLVGDHAAHGRARADDTGDALPEPSPADRFRLRAP